MKTNRLLILICTIFTVTSCNLNGSDEIQEIPVTEKTAALLQAENKFGFELFQRVYSHETNTENIMISPLSVSLALAMTYNGADGETKSAMEKTLKVYGLTADDINQSYYDLVNALNSLDQKVLLEIADAIFYRHDFEVEQDFVKVNKNYYNAEVSALDFGSPTAVDEINNWVAEKTHDKIKTILNEISPSHMMFLLNAIYFKGTWQKEFNTENTKELPFYTASGETVQAEAMQRLDTIPYLINDLFSAIRLDYGTGNYNMYIFLPEDGKNLEDIVYKLDKDNWETWMDGFNNTPKVDIQLPKFKYRFEIKLNQALSEMGMGVAFSDDANFTGINRSGNLKIDYVKHKSFIEVNEEGTEAAAVTIVGVETTSVGNGPQNVPFYVNRPFLYAITEKGTGAILFLGTVKNPLNN